MTQTKITGWLMHDFDCSGVRGANCCFAKLGHRGEAEAEAESNFALAMAAMGLGAWGRR